MRKKCTQITNTCNDQGQVENTNRKDATVSSRDKIFLKKTL